MTDGDPRLSPGYTWPDGFERTDPDDRGSYPGDLTVTRKDAFLSIAEEVEKWGGHDVRVNSASQHYADTPNQPHASDYPDDPTVVAQYRRAEEDAETVLHLPCDRWATQLENARAIALFARRQRLAERCGVSLARSTHAVAGLPPGDPERDQATPAAPADPLDGRDPADVLNQNDMGVMLGSDPERSIVETVARQLKAKYHPDSGEDPDAREFKAVVAAEEELVDDA